MGRQATLERPPQAEEPPAERELAEDRLRHRLGSRPDPGRGEPHDREAGGAEVLVLAVVVLEGVVEVVPRPRVDLDDRPLVDDEPVGAPPPLAAGDRLVDARLGDAVTAAEVDEVDLGVARRPRDGGARPVPHRPQGLRPRSPLARVRTSSTAPGSSRFRALSSRTCCLSSLRRSRSASSSRSRAAVAHRSPRQVVTSRSSSRRTRWTTVSRGCTPERRGIVTCGRARGSNGTSPSRACSEAWPTTASSPTARTAAHAAPAAS
jgi:hypothetical protein